MTTLKNNLSAKSDELIKITKIKYQYYPEISNTLGSVNAGLLLSYLIDARIENAEGVWLSNKVDAVREKTGLSRVQQKTAIRVLLKNDLIESKRAGLPSTRHFKLNAKVLTDFLRTPSETEIKL